MLYSDGYGGMEGRTVVCRISVIREWQLAHFPLISQDGYFPTRIVLWKSHENHTIFSYASDALLLRLHFQFLCSLYSHFNIVDEGT